MAFMKNTIKIPNVVTFTLCLIFAAFGSGPIAHAALRAGAAKVDITHPDSKQVSSPLYSRALVIQDENTTIVLVSMDVVAIGGIGYIKNEFLPNVRRRVKESLGIDGTSILINASHCHGIPSSDSESLTVQAIEAAYQNLEAVTVGVGSGSENRIMENRRMFLKSGREIDVRHAYSLPPNKDIAATGPIDPEIGILLLRKTNGETLAAVYNFACHPIQGVPNGENTADITGFSSQVIEDNLSPGTVALFFQGCGGDINPISYKDIEHPRDAEPLGNLLGLSTLKGIRRIETTDTNKFKLIHETIELPRANLAPKIIELQRTQQVLLKSLGGTTLNLRQFMQLTAKHNLDPDFPSYHASRYLHDESLGHSDLKNMDVTNRKNMNAYLRNVYTMEELTRLGANLRLLIMHQQQNLDADKRTITVETIGLKIGDFEMVTFPGELTVRIGLGIKERAKHPHTFVAGYTNGYIYYAPTAKQLLNVGGAQEDSDCILDPAWQAIFEKQVTSLLQRLR